MKRIHPLFAATVPSFTLWLVEAYIRWHCFPCIGAPQRVSTGEGHGHASGRRPAVPPCLSKKFQGLYIKVGKLTNLAFLWFIFMILWVRRLCSVPAPGTGYTEGHARTDCVRNLKKQALFSNKFSKSINIKLISTSNLDGKVIVFIKCIFKSICIFIIQILFLICEYSLKTARLSGTELSLLASVCWRR
jgi:hypothetical protein